ncbi:ribosomal RNA small subunit methyltransferase NEP1 [Parasteatoda tepidariorum]|uniref:ribosomal RNA small subunit methyltransferase NEP1 n=1 Tax=Parasteatoda tepidariorum TaxID=114398 RepID=UPI00077FD876|nr:ribosomal RNA small subunit methyltransferase NEP1 [Parasteatoda tepidariorum]
MALKRQHVMIENDEEENKEDLKSIPKHIRKQDKRLIIVLENANLETVKNGQQHELLNSEDHLHIIKKKKITMCRPDITHQCLLMLFDSPLNRAGLLQVYVHTERNALIEINPQTRIPRTFKRFSGLMVQLLHKLTIRSGEGNQRLMKVIKNPVTDHLPVGCKKIATSFSSEKIVHPRDLVPPDEPIVIVVGAMAHGQVTADYAEETVSISGYPLSAALTCSKFCSAFEEVWGVQ